MAYPDTLVGTDSHTTMINGLGVLGWGVGGIEAEAAMLGQPVSMLIPQVVGFKLKGRLPEGATATDLVLTVTEILRKKGVVGKFVEFHGEGLASLPLADRATIANMAPEYGATCGIFPIDAETIRYLRFSGRSDALIQLVVAQAGVHAAAYWLMRDVFEANLRLFEAKQAAEIHEHVPERPRADDMARAASSMMRAANPIVFALRSLGSALVVVALTRRRSREFFRAAGEAVEER